MAVLLALCMVVITHYMVWDRILPVLIATIEGRCPWLA